MFQDSLLESSNVARKSKEKRRSMTMAFVLELIVAAFVLMVPLMSTGVIPVMAHVPHPIAFPMNSVEIADRVPSNSSGNKQTATLPAPVVQVFNNPNALHIGPPQPPNEKTIDPLAQVSDQSSRPAIGDLIVCKSDCTAIARPAEPLNRVRLSHLSEALLIRKVDPVYPRTAVLAHIFGAVQLHAIIAKDGSIQSLNVISGSPILAQAALDAVRQWRYKPYMLNDQVVEVETFITVHFRPAGN